MKNHAPSLSQIDPIKNEIHNIGKRLEKAKRKRKKLENRCAAQDVQLKKLLDALKAEQKDTARRELEVRIRTRLEDWAFYRDDGGKEL